MKFKKLLLYPSILLAILSSQDLHASTPFQFANDQAEVNFLVSCGGYRERNLADPVYPSSFSPGDATTLSYLQGIKFGTPTTTLNSLSYFLLDSNNILNVVTNALTAGTWSLFQSSALASSYTLTTPIVLTETLRNGVNPSGTAYTFTLTLTKTGTPATFYRDLTAAAADGLTPTFTLSSFLQKATVLAFPILTGTGTAIASAISLPTGSNAWLVTGLFKNSSAVAVSETLEPISFGITLPMTPSNGSSVCNFLATIANAGLYNVAANAITDLSVAFASANGNGIQLSLKFRPGYIVRTSSVQSGIVASLSTLTNLRLYATSTTVGIHNNPVSSINNLVARNVSTNNKPLYDKLLDENLAIAANTEFAIGNVGVAVDTNRLSLTMLGALDLTSAVWTVNGSIVTVSGTLGNLDSQVFSYDFSNPATVQLDSTHSPVFAFKSPSGQAIIVKIFASSYATLNATTATDPSGNPLSAAEQSEILAGALFNIVSSTVTIPHKTGDAI